jgi:hypothetical protein
MFTWELIWSNHRIINEEQEIIKLNFVNFYSRILNASVRAFVQDKKLFVSIYYDSPPWNFGVWLRLLNNRNLFDALLCISIQLIHYYFMILNKVKLHNFSKSWCRPIIFWCKQKGQHYVFDEHLAVNPAIFLALKKRKKEKT